MFQALGRLLLVILAAVFFLTTSASAQQKLKLRPLRIALPSNTIGATHYYVGKSLGIFESYGFEPQILVLEPRAALAACGGIARALLLVEVCGLRARRQHRPVHAVRSTRPRHLAQTASLSLATEGLFSTRLTKHQPVLCV